MPTPAAGIDVFSINRIMAHERRALPSFFRSSLPSVRRPSCLQAFQPHKRADPDGDTATREKCRCADVKTSSRTQQGMAGQNENHFRSERTVIPLILCRRLTTSAVCRHHETVGTANQDCCRRQRFCTFGRSHLEQSNPKFVYLEKDDKTHL